MFTDIGSNDIGSNEKGANDKGQNDKGSKWKKYLMYYFRFSLIRLRQFLGRT